MTSVPRGALLGLAVGVALGAQPLRAQAPTRIDPEYGRIMLQTIERNLRSHYYDTTYHGVNLDSVFRRAEARVAGARDNTQLFAIIAEAVLALKDSHTTFWPPERAVDVRYGWQVAIVGESCYVIGVAPPSDAARQGVRDGDRVLAVDGFAITRANAWQLTYVLGRLNPLASVALTLQAPDGGLRIVQVASKVTPEKTLVNLSGSDGGMDYWRLVRQDQNWDHRHRSEYASVDSILVWRLRTFLEDEDEIDAGIARARRHRALILDLRGDQGGYTTTLQRLIGRLFDWPVRVGTTRRRQGPDSLVAKPAGNPFTGPLMVLVDSRSASAAEILAGTVQMEKRGTVIGDRSMGAVMGSLCYRLTAGSEIVLIYDLCVTVEDIVLSNGARLEGRGVVPDEVVLPSGADLAAGRDPALAAALARLGHPIDATAAGRLLPRDDDDLLW